MRRSSLNQVYRLVWNAARACWMAVCEHSKAKGKGGRTAALAVVAMLAQTDVLAVQVDTAQTTFFQLTGSNNLTVGVNGSIDTGTSKYTNSVTEQVYSGAVYTDTTSAANGAVIVNSGTISGLMGVQHSNGTLTSITNRGKIIGSASGIVNGVKGTINTITNYGEISGSGTGIANFGNSVGTGTISNVYNYGLIKGIYSINNKASTIGTGKINIIDNYGTLDGKVELGDAQLNLGEAASRVTGFVSGSTKSSVNVNGSFTTEDAFNIGTFSIAKGATLNIAHDITATFGFNNHGTLAVADGITANVIGSYTQDGVLSIGASSGTSYGKLNVDGTATLNSGASFNVNAADQSTLANGNKLTGVLVATTLTNKAGTLTVTDNSKLFDFTAAVNGNQVDFTTVAAGTTNSTASVAGSITRTGFTRGAGAANVFDFFVKGGKASADMGNVVTALGKLSTDNEISKAVQKTLPLFASGVKSFFSSVLRGFGRAIQSRQKGRGRSSGDELLSDEHFWLKPVGSWGHQSDRNGISGFSVDSYGMVGGVDGEINDSTHVGVALSYMNSKVDAGAASNADIDAYQASVYGSHTLAASPNTEVSWQAAIGTSKNKSSRLIDFSDLSRVAGSDYDSYSASIGAGIARSFAINDKTTITPSIRADYTWMRNPSYTETGADALNLKVAGQSTDELIVLTEGSLAHKLTDKTTLMVNAGVGYDVLHGKNSMTASYVGGGAAFTTQGMDVSPWLSRAGLGLAVNATETTEITARYDAEARSDFIDQTASVKVRWMF